MNGRPTALRVEGLAKCYPIYAQPRDRLKQFVFPRLARVAGRPAARYYREFWALRDVSFAVAAGETVGIVGRNGSGKSTLLQLICGTLHPTAGTIEAHGRIAALLELGSGFNPEFTGRENVFLYAAVLGLTRAQTEARWDEILAFSEIGAFIDQPIKTYSSGMVVRLAFSVAIHVEPSLLVVDEALSVGDERFQRKCYGRIEAMRQRGVTILFVSHSAGTVVELCDRALLLDDGELLMTGEPKRVVASYQRLLYAPADQRDAVRRSLLAGESSPATTATASTDSARADGARDGSPATEGEAFDPQMKPTSTVHYESRGVRLDGWGLYNARGDAVNHLVRGRRYRYRYKARFDETITHVRFGMMVKSMTGIELGGAASSPPGVPTCAVVHGGAEIGVDFEFACRLAPGVYFLNAGVVADVGGEETYVHRVIDALMFRVVAEEADTMTGLMDFACTATVETASPLAEVDAVLVAAATTGGALQNV